MHSFDEVDQEGVETLQQERFVECEGMLFRQSVFIQEVVHKALQCGQSKAEIQVAVNHQSLISFGSNLEQQKENADKISRAWLQRLKSEFPNVYGWVIVEISSQEVIISLRVN